MSGMQLTQQLTIIKKIKSTLKSGIALDKLFQDLAAKEKDSDFKKQYRQISNELKDNISLGVALEKQSDIFNTLFVKLIRAGEASGSLESILTQIENIIEDMLSTKKLILDSLAPLYRTIIGFLIIFFIIFFVEIPLLEKFFKNMQFPTATPIILLNILGGNFFIFVIIVVLLLCNKKIRKELIEIFSEELEFLKKAYYKTVMGLPLIGQLYKLINQYTYFYSFKTCYAAGLSYIETTDLASETVLNPYLKTQYLSINDSIIRGENVSASFEQSTLFNQDIIASLQLAEETGDIEYHIDDVIRLIKEEIDKIFSLISKFLSFLPLIVGFLALCLQFCIIGNMLFSALGKAFEITNYMINQ